MLEDQIPEPELRDLYVRGTLSQRYRVALDRLQNPDHGPNQVVTAVSCLEGLARAIAVKHLQAQGMTVEVAYGELRSKMPLVLLTKYVLPSMGQTPDKAFDPVSWKLVPRAVEFRNLLVHEATYLSGGTCDQLVKAVLHVFHRIAELSGAKR